MSQLLDRTTLAIMLSALLLAIACLLPEIQNMFPLWIIRMGAHSAGTLFHELGHSLFMWLFGVPNIPMIFTLFGADQAGGLTMQLGGRNWMLQITALLGLIYGCYWIKDHHRGLLYVTISFSLFILIMALSNYYTLISLYMGHGSELLVGGFLLFRGWVNMDTRNAFERWLNGFFGFFLTLNVLFFSYHLAFDTQFNKDYSNHTIFGSGDNDFVAMTHLIPSWTVEDIALFNLIFGGAIMLLSFFLACRLTEKEKPVIFVSHTAKETTMPASTTKSPRIVDKEW